MPFKATCNDLEKVLIHVQPQDDAGHAEPLHGPIKVVVLSGDGTAVVQTDGLSFFAVAGTLDADTVYEVSGNADLGTGDIEIKDQVTLTVTHPMAKNFGFVADAPVSK